MKLSKIRDYLDSRINALNLGLTKWDDGFNADNIPSSIINKSYHVAYSFPSVEQNQATQNYITDIEIKFFFKAFRSVSDQIDDSYDLVNTIAKNLTSIEEIESYRSTDDFPIQVITVNSIINEQLFNNDNAIIVTLNLSATIIDINC